MDGYDMWKAGLVNLVGDIQDDDTEDPRPGEKAPSCADCRLEHYCDFSEVEGHCSVLS